MIPFQQKDKKRKPLFNLNAQFRIPPKDEKEEKEISDSMHKCARELDQKGLQALSDNVSWFPKEYSVHNTGPTHFLRRLMEIQKQTMVTRHGKL